MRPGAAAGARWRLFSPARYDGLPGWRFPAPAWSFPTKDEMADYLEAYAERFELPVVTGARVDGLAKDGVGFLVTAGERRFAAAAVVVATGAHRTPRTPALAAELDPRIHQLHSRDYRDPSGLPGGPALVVGAGNSGAEIALELARTRPVWLAGRDVGEIPVPHGSRRCAAVPPAHPLPRPPGADGPHAGRPPGWPRASPTARRRWIRTRTRRELLAAGVERVPRVADTRDGLPVLEDGRALQPAVVVWCTGFRQDFSWIDLPIFDPQGDPRHDRGIATDVPGLYFVGLNFLYAFSSTMIHGVSRDAERIARAIAARRSAAAGSARGMTIPSGASLPARV